MAAERPDRVSIDIEPQGSVLAVMRAIVNDLPVVMSSLHGRNEVRSPGYASPFEAKLSVQVMWYDVDTARYYQHDFDLDARELSTFGEAGQHAYVSITLGPGADITVTTPHPEGLRLVGLNRMDDITPEMDVPVTLAELCAAASDTDPSEDHTLRAAMQDSDAVARASLKRDNWLREAQAPAPRCMSEGRP